MKRLSAYVQLKRTHNIQTGLIAWCAFWRGTINRIKDKSGNIVPGRLTQKQLRWDLLNYEMENGVVIETFTATLTD